MAARNTEALMAVRSTEALMAVRSLHFLMTVPSAQALMAQPKPCICLYIHAESLKEKNGPAASRSPTCNWPIHDARRCAVGQCMQDTGALGTTFLHLARQCVISHIPGISLASEVWVKVSRQLRTRDCTLLAFVLPVTAVSCCSWCAAKACVALCKSQQYGPESASEY